MKRAVILLLCAVTFFGCKGDTSTNLPNGSKTGFISFVISEHNARLLRPGEHFVFWWKTIPDTGWQKLYDSATPNYMAADSASYFGSFPSNISLDSVIAARVTIEPPAKGVDLVLVETDTLLLSGDKKTLTAPFSAKKFQPDYSALAGSIVFTSPLADTLAYTHEFYLMNYSDKSASVQSLPLPPKGWQYGLWAEDSAFTPHQYFLYGLFSTPKGHDSDSSNDHYAFPGGWKPQQMNVGSGSILVTLEPLFYVDSLRYKGPSPFPLLRFDRLRFLNKNLNYPMINVAGGAIPYGVLTLRK